MKITYLGHSAILMEGSKTILIDPFISGNPQAKNISLPDRIDFIVVTHDHSDHIGDAFEIAKERLSTIVTQHEIAIMAQEKGLNAEGMNVGGPVELSNVKFYFTNAVHSSGTGHPMGAVIEMEEKRLYHAGDTGLFSDMRLISDYFRPDLAFLPIGGRYTMDEEQAAYALKNLLRVKKVIPIHYNTWPPISADPMRFRELVGDAAEVIILSIGQSTEI